MLWGWMIGGGFVRAQIFAIYKSATFNAVVSLGLKSIRVPAPSNKGGFIFFASYKSAPLIDLRCLGRGGSELGK